MRSTHPYKTTVLSADSPAQFEAAVVAAAAVLKQGGLVALPTETVYGLAGNALDPEAVSSIFTAKGRPPHNPMIVHVADASMATACAAEWPQAAQKLADAFWPGPLTLVVPRATRIPDIVAAGGPTVAIRWPAHPIMLAVIRACGFPLAAPSANISNRASPTTANHVLRQLGGRIPLIVDGGACNVGIESTVVDLTSEPAQVLRPGMIHEQALRAVVGDLKTGSTGHPGALKSPGMLRRHYSPAARLLVWAWRSEEDLLGRLAAAGFRPGETAIVSHNLIPGAAGFGRVAVVPRDARAFARSLYGELHACDDAGLKLIIVEEPPNGSEWKGIWDRLMRASAE